MNGFRIIHAEEKDIPGILNVMDRVSSEIHNVDLFFADDEEFIRRHISDEGFILVATQEDLIVGFLIVRFPRNAEDNLALDSDRDICPGTVFHIESVAILPEYRGNGLQKTLIMEGEKIAVHKGFGVAMATVSPYNQYSLSNMADLGYSIIDTRPKYGSVRNILFKHC